MSTLDEQLAAECAEQEKRGNAPNDAKTNELLILMCNRLGRRILVAHNLELKPDYVATPYTRDKATLRVRGVSGSLRDLASVPDWLRPGTGMQGDHNDVCAAWFADGKYTLECKTAHGPIFNRVLDTPDDVIAAMERYVADL